jgi:hypothetical protein
MSSISLNVQQFCNIATLQLQTARRQHLLFTDEYSTCDGFNNLVIHSTDVLVSDSRTTAMRNAIHVLSALEIPVELPFA